MTPTPPARRNSRCRRSIEPFVSEEEAMSLAGVYAARSIVSSRFWLTLVLVLGLAGACGGREPGASGTGGMNGRGGAPAMVDAGAGGIGGGAAGGAAGRAIGIDGGDAAIAGANGT